MAFSQLGDAYVRQAQWDDAIATLQKSIWLNPYYSAPYILMGRAYMKKAQPAVAEGMLRRAIEFDPNNRAAHYLLAQLLQQTGREEDAKREFEIAERLRGPPGSMSDARLFAVLCACCAADCTLSATPGHRDAWPVTFTDIAEQAGLRHPSIYGGVETKRFILETNGCGTG